MAGIITDPIGDMLTRVRNGNQRKHKVVSVPKSQARIKILEILEAEGYITSFEVIKPKVEKKTDKKNVDKKSKIKQHEEINIHLKYSNDERVISGVRRISKPGLRVYANVNELPRVLSGYGIAIISTSKGLMTDRKARELKMGGEIIAYV